MKKTLTTIIGVVAILLAITACQPKYVIFPFPGGTNTPSGNANNEISTFAALKDALENGADGKYVLKKVPIDPNTDSLPIRVNGNKEFSGTANITDTVVSSGATANSIMLFADNTEGEKLVIFEIQDTATVKFTDFTATVASTVANKVEAVISVDAGAITANNVSITVEGTSEGTSVTGIALGENAKAENISVETSNIVVNIDENNQDESLIDKIESSEDTTIVTAYDSANETDFTNNLTTKGKARLLADITVSDLQLPVDFNEISINLNGKSLTLNISENNQTIKDSFGITTGKNVTIKNGTLAFSRNDENLLDALIRVYTNASLTLEGVTMDTHQMPLMANDSASAVTVSNCNIISDSYYVFGTNAADGDQNITINISGSTLETRDPDSVAAMINIENGTMNITNSTLIGGRQAVVLRGGNGTFTDSTLITRGDFTGSTYFDSDWGSGNNAPLAAVVIGNRSNGHAYDYPTSCTLSNTTLQVGKAGQESTPNTEAKLIYVSSDNGMTTTVTLEGTSTKYEDDIRSNYWGENTYIGTEKLDAKTN